MHKKHCESLVTAMKTIYYNLNDDAYGKKCYGVRIDVYPGGSGMKRILSHLINIEAPIVIGIFGDSNFNTDHSSYIICETLNDAKVVMNLLNGKYKVGYPEEASIPMDLYLLMEDFSYGMIHSMDGLVNVMHYYFCPSADDVQSYYQLDEAYKTMRRDAMQYAFQKSQNEKENDVNG